jgi:hypothetical protein
VLFDFKTMPKPKRLYHTGANVPTDYDYEANKRVLLLVCIPKSAMWIAMYKGLLSMPMNYWFWRLDSTIAHNAVKQAKDVFYNGVTMICQDELSYNLREMNFTLKRIENQLCDNKEIKTFGQQPTIAKTEAGDIDYAVNNTVNNSTNSVFVTEQYIDPLGIITQKYSIADVMATALVEGAVVIDPIGQSLFSLKSKFDQIRTDINVSQLHFTNGFTTLMSWFASSFRETPYKVNNPFSENSFYNIFTTTFNKTTTENIQQQIPGWLGAWIPDWIDNSFLATIKFLQVDESYIKQANDNFVTTFNETNTDGVASNSYFRYLHTWLNSDWKLFHDLMGTMRDCICEAKGFIEGLIEPLNGITSAISGVQLDPTINIDVSPTPVTLNCGGDDDGVGDIINNLGDTIKNMGDTLTNINNTIGQIGDNIYNDNSTTTTVDNGDNTYTTTVTNPPKPPITNTPTVPIDYPPLDPNDPNGETTKPYNPTSIIKRNSRNALCGFNYYYLTMLADVLETLFNLIQGFSFLFDIMSPYKATKTIIESGEIFNAVAPNGLVLPKIPSTSKVSMIMTFIKIKSIFGLVMMVWPGIMREAAHDYACGINGVVPFKTKSDFINVVISLLGVGVPPMAASYAGFLAGMVWDYYGATDSGNAMIDMNDYKQYCPCPIEGQFNGDFWNGTTGNGEKWLFLGCDGITVNGTVTSINLFGTLYESEIINGIVDPNNELSAGGTLTVTSHEGFPDTSFTMQASVDGNEVYYGVPSQTYIRVS